MVQPNKSRPKRLVWLVMGCLILLPVSACFGVAIGSEPVALEEVFRVLLYHLSLGHTPAPDPTVDRVIWALRLPRVLLAMIVGGGLAVVGVSMQALVRNPLAEPYILGISSGASAGASLFYLGFLPPLFSIMLSMPLAAFLGGLISITLVYFVARENGRLSVARLLLAGVAMSALMASLTSFITYASPDPFKLHAILFWLLGSLHHAHWGILLLPFLVSVLSLFLLLGFSRPMDSLLIGDEPAHSLGVPVEMTKTMLLILAALVTGTLVAASGTIGFVGLIIPHAVRSFTGVTHRRLLPVAYLAGALFLVWSDLIGRIILPSQQLPVGVITALCGVPFFLYLLRKGKYAFGG